MERSNILQIIVTAVIAIALLWLSRRMGYLDNVATLTLGLLVWSLVLALLRKIGVDV